MMINIFVVKKINFKKIPVTGREFFCRNQTENPLQTHTTSRGKSMIATVAIITKDSAEPLMLRYSLLEENVMIETSFM